MSAFLRIAWIVLRKDLTVEIRIYNKRGTAEQWIKEGKQAAHWTIVVSSIPPRTRSACS
jgi:hypothetical protein